MRRGRTKDNWRGSEKDTEEKKQQKLETVRDRDTKRRKREGEKTKVTKVTEMSSLRA